MVEEPSIGNQEHGNVPMCENANSTGYEGEDHTQMQLTKVQSHIKQLKALRRGQMNRSFLSDRVSQPSRTFVQSSNRDYDDLTGFERSPPEHSTRQTRTTKQLLEPSSQSMESVPDLNGSFSGRQSTADPVDGSQQGRSDLSPGLVKLSFALIFYMNLIINVDHGVMPAGAITIKEYLGVTNTEYGLLGSIVFFGLVLGSLAATFVFNNVNTKAVLFAIMTLNALSQFAFTTTNCYEYLIGSRFLTGFFQVFISIYWPVWTDAFAQCEKRKATWMSCFLASSPVGVLFGYVLTTQLIINYTWKYAFYAQGVAVVPALLLSLLIPNKYFSLKPNATSASQATPDASAGGAQSQNFVADDESASNERQLDLASDEGSLKEERPARDSIRQNVRSGMDLLGRSYGTDQIDALFLEVEGGTHGNNTLENLGMTPTTPQIETLQSIENESTLYRIVELIKNGQFVLLTLAISSLYFVVTGLQYWVSAYLMITMEINQEEVYYYYAFTCLSAPIGGVIIGGIIFSCIGGYNSPRAQALATLLGFFASVACLPIPFCTNKYLVYLLLWCVFFFGATIIAPLVGFMLSAVQAERRTTANSIATLSYNLFGYLPAPFIYGIFSDIFPDDQKSSHRVALAVILYWSIIAMVMMMLSMILYLKKQTQLHNKTIKELFRKHLDSAAGKESTTRESISAAVDQVLHPATGDTGSASGEDDEHDFGVSDYLIVKSDNRTFMKNHARSMVINHPAQKYEQFEHDQKRWKKAAGQQRNQSFACQGQPAAINQDDCELNFMRNRRDQPDDYSDDEESKNGHFY